MESFQVPSDQEISAAFTQGEAAVIALFHRSLGQLAAQLTMLEDPVSKSSQFAESAVQVSEGRRTIRQGDIYWAALDAPGIIHPHVVIQENVINRSRIHSVVVCALTSNRNRASLPGNVLLEAGEGNLPRQSVVEVSKVSAVDKTQLGEYIGSLTEQRVKQILAGMQFQQSFAGSVEIDEKK